MKRITFNLATMSLIILLMTLIGSCSKNGDIGPKGDQGEQGIPGANGATILSGNIDPVSAQGKLGDFYLNLTSGNLFGPKKTEGWGIPLNLSGPSGENGKDGSSILAGNGVPPISFGEVGDFYIDKIDLAIYGPKTTNSWGNPLSLKSIGEKGEQGIPGANGSTILSGNVDPTNDNGKVGDFYLNLISGDLFGPKSVGGWPPPFNLKGPKGENGKDGNSLLSGNGIPALMIGKIGDFYIDKINQTIYGPKMENSWGEPVSLKSNVELGVAVFHIDPVTDQYFKCEKIDNYKGYFVGPYYKSTGRTKTIAIPNGYNRLNECYYTLYSRYDGEPPINSTKWMPFSNGLRFEKLQTSLDGGFEYFDLKIKNEEFDFVSKEMRFYIDVEAVGNSDFNPIKYIPMPNLGLIIKSTSIESVNKLSKSYRDVNRYMRIKGSINHL